MSDQFLHKLTVTRDIEIVLSPQDVGEAFANMADDEQAEALRRAVEVLRSVEDGAGRAVMQGHYIARRLARDPKFSDARTWLENLVGSMNEEGSAL